MSYANLPIKERITLAIIAALDDIIAGQTYSIGDGAGTGTGTWNITISGVERAKYSADGVLGNTPADLKIVLHEGDAVPVDDGPIRWQEWKRPYVATIFIYDNDPAIPIGQKLAVVSADVSNCLMRNRQWSGLAEDTFPAGTNSQMSGEDILFIDVNFEVQFKTLENDEYSPAS